MNFKHKLLRAVNNLEPSSFDGRYEVSREREVIEHFATFREALDCALRHGEDSEIFDRMAHRGKPQLWQIIAGFATIRTIRASTINGNK